jgi:hypothetical protein
VHASSLGDVRASLRRRKSEYRWINERAAFDTQPCAAESAQEVLYTGTINIKLNTVTKQKLAHETSLFLYHIASFLALLSDAAVKPLGSELWHGGGGQRPKSSRNTVGSVTPVTMFNSNRHSNEDPCMYSSSIACTSIRFLLQCLLTGRPLSWFGKGGMPSRSATRSS